MNYYDNILLIIQGGFAQFRFSFYLNKHFLHCKSLQSEYNLSAANSCNTYNFWTTATFIKIFTNIWLQI